MAMVQPWHVRSVHGGTVSSNPLCSSGESGANLIFGGESFGEFGLARLVRSRARGCIAPAPDICAGTRQDAKRLSVQNQRQTLVVRLARLVSRFRGIGGERHYASVDGQARVRLLGLTHRAAVWPAQPEMTQRRRYEDARGQSAC
jgi:hypothetical protein